MPDSPLRVLLVSSGSKPGTSAVRRCLDAAEGLECSIVASRSFARAKELALKDRCDVCLVDADGHPAEGLRFLQDLKMAGSLLPVIFIADSADHNEDVDAFTAGAADYLAGDQLTPDLLERSIRYAMGHYRSLRTLQDVRDELEARIEERTGELSKANAELAEVHTRNAHILESIADAFFAVDKGWRFTYVNAQAERLFGERRRRMLGANLWELFPRAVGTPWYSACYEAMENLRPVETEQWDESRQRWFSARMYPSADGLSGFITDITERKEMEERVRRQALYDPLTDLPNRAFFEARLEQAIRAASRDGERVGVLFLDFDRFKTINDTLGHAKGDRIIKQAAGRLRRLEAADGAIARFGADEFLVMVTGIRDPNELAQAAEKAQSLLRRPFEIGGRAMYVNASIGIAMYPDDGASAEVLVKNADTALYRAKEVGRNTYRFYANTMHFKASEDLALENDLRQALERDELTVYYQPIVPLDDGQDLRAEALLRWNHPQFGTIFPNEFIPLAEEIGVIVKLGEWALGKVCDQLLEWRSRKQPVVPVAFNVSPRQFVQPDFTERLLAIIRGKGVDPELIQVEVTESIAMHNVGASAEKLADLQKAGIRVSVDDFGTGHSSLSYLKQLPIDRIKIDKSFTKNCTHDARDAAIVKAIIAVAKTLGLSVCAEGIESEEQVRFLSSLGCESVQGFLFSKSVPAAQFVEWAGSYLAGSRELRPVTVLP